MEEAVDVRVGVKYRLDLEVDGGGYEAVDVRV